MTVHAGEDEKQGRHSFIAGESAVTVEISVAVLQDPGNRAIPRSSYTTLDDGPKGLSILLLKHLLNHVHCCSICGSQK